MKKSILVAILAVMMMVLVGCSKEEYNESIISDQESQIENLKTEISDLQKQKEEIKTSVVEAKEEAGIANYIVAIEIKQSHIFFDLSNNIKDEMNAIEIEMPVSKEYYYNVEIGTVINDEFRVGSLIMSNSIGSWEITVVNKEVR